mgnify:CR=1 FL=1
MKIMVIGGGGREDAIIKKISENKNIEKIYALPGNGGIMGEATCVDIGAEEIYKARDFAVKEKIDFAIVAPDDPLAMGAVDILEEAGIKCFGPDKSAAEIESSKVFAKNLMKKYNIPTAEYEVFSEIDSAMEYVKTCKIPIVIKADGLAKGKGVIIAMDRDSAISAIKEIMQDKKFGDSGNEIVVEEFLEGPEVSVLSFTDGKTIVPMISSMDHKRANDGDKGPNTGGMGCIAPNPFYTEEIAKRCLDEIFVPTIDAMNKEGRTFKGCLYFGLMITEDGPKVIEYNCRFGDPETQVVLPLLESDLLEIMIAVREGRLSEDIVKFSKKSACCVVMASGGYPNEYEKGYEIKIGKISDNSIVYIAGAKRKDDKLITNGGRVLGLTAIDDTLEGAVSDAYDNIEKISFKKAYYRKDIGSKALIEAL